MTSTTALRFTAAAGGIGGVFYWRMNQSVPLVNPPRLVSSLPSEVKLNNVTLYQYESCPFCRKVRGVLDYSGVPYKIVEVHPLTKAETKPFAAEYGKVPILTVSSGNDNYQLRDSSRIIENVLLTTSGPLKPSPATVGRPLGPKTWKVDDEPSIEDEWVRWTDARLVQLIVANIYCNLGESKETFNYLLTHDKFNWFSKMAVLWSGTVVMTMVASKRRKTLGLEKGQEREALYDAIRMFLDTGLAKHPFLGGDSPNKADFNIYGVMRSIEGFSTQSDLFQNVSEFGFWYSRMEAAVGDSMAVAHENAGARGEVALDL